jgi:glutathione peroxidase
MNFYDIDLVAIDGKQRKMDVYRGKTLLIVNVASQCGFTPQYEGLQALYDKFKDRGFVVLGFPCNQFGHQEPNAEAEIEQFCTRNYGVTFPMFEKIDVNGVNAHPLYRYLKSEKPGILRTEAIKWNFTKFLVGSDGTVLKRYAPSDKPEAIEADLAARL